MRTALFELSVKLLTIAAALSAVSCDMAPSELTGSINKVGKPVVTTVFFYDNIKQVQDKYREVHKIPKDQAIGTTGFARWAEYRDINGKPIEVENEPHTCVIHTVRPTQIDDEATKTLGHEMLHCLIGTYHPQGDRH